jgi:hypothetical protein
MDNLRGIVGGARPDEKSRVDLETAIGLRARLAFDLHPIDLHGGMAIKDSTTAKITSSDTRVGAEGGV